MNKQAITFLSLFSLIFMLSIYYILLPPLDLQTASNIEVQDELSENTANLQDELNKQQSQEVASYNQIIAAKESTIEDVADALKEINQINGDQILEKEIKQKIEEMSYQVELVEIKDDVIKITLKKNNQEIIIPDIINKANELSQNKYLVEIKIIE